MATSVGILLFPRAEPLDFVGPAQVFWSYGSARRRGADLPPVEVHLVAERDEAILTRNGFVVHPTVSYGDCGPLDVLVVPGGTGEDDDRDPASVASGRLFQMHHEPTLAFVRDQATHAAIVASVCTGAFVLAGAGLLAGRRVNTHWYARDELVSFMASRGESITIVPERVVDDGDLITAGGVTSGIDLALHVLERLFGPDARAAASAVVERETPP